jgi:hypothetical protein
VLAVTKTSQIPATALVEHELVVSYEETRRKLQCALFLHTEVAFSLRHVNGRLKRVSNIRSRMLESDALFCRRGLPALRLMQSPSTSLVKHLGAAVHEFEQMKSTLSSTRALEYALERIGCLQRFHTELEAEDARFREMRPECGGTGEGRRPVHISIELVISR